MAKSAVPPPSALCPDIHAGLLSLPPTREGFEGLVAALIEAASDGAIRLMASGDQLGLDGIADPVDGGPRRAMQAKRYGDTTSLDQTLLLGEMTRAHDAFPSIDCWILPTTQQLHGKEARGLRNHAESLGWGFVALDWSPVQPGLPRLAVLCALYPDVSARWPALAAVRNSLAALSAHPGFDVASTIVRDELNAADVGYVAAHRFALVHMERIWSDRAAARMIAGPSPALMTEAPPVLRKGLRAAVAAWWTTPVTMHALLGGEGVGKTWAALDGLRAIARLPYGPLPIVIPSSLAKQAVDGFAAVVAALCGIGDNAGLKVADAPSFWRRRLAIWAATSQGSRTSIVVLIDGLDELDPFDWQRWSAALMTADRAGLFRLLLTCRPDEWSRSIGLQEPGREQVVETRVGLFEVSEREEYLQTRGVDPAAVSPEVLEAALHPRTAFHLTRLADELGDLKRITREQLLLRDFRNYHSIKGGIMQPDAFEELVRRMAIAAQDAALAQRAYQVGQGEMLAAAADIAGYERSQMRSVLSDLVNGRWFTRDPTSSTRLIFTDAGLPDAVGLALAHHVSRLPASAALTEITRFLEPWGADDLIEKVLRTCATALVIYDQVGDELCSAVLERWRNVPTHGGGGQDFWRRLHIFRPRLFLDACERNGGRGDWLLEWGIAKLWEDHASARKLVSTRLSSWLTRIGVPNERTASDPDQNARVNHQRLRQRRRAAALERRAPGDWLERIGTDHADLPRHAAVIAGRVIGFLPRAPFVQLFRDWAINCAAAGHVTHERVVEVLLRFNDRDAVEALAAARSATDLVQSDNSMIGKVAAANLLRATGASDDAARADELDARSTRTQSSALGRVVRDAPVQRHRHRPMDAYALFGPLVAAAVDPTASLDVETSDDLSTAVSRLTADDVPMLFQQDGQAIAVVMRWHPGQAFELVRDYLLVRDVPDTKAGPESLDVFRDIAVRSLPFLRLDECAKLADRLASSAQSDQGVDDPDSADAERRSGGHWQALALRLVRLPHTGQIAALHAAIHWPDGYRFLLSRPTQAELAAYVEAIDFDVTSFELNGRLAIAIALLQRYEHEPIPRNWRKGFNYPDADVRRRTITLAHLSDPQQAARQLVGTPWSAKATADAFEAFDGSRLIETLDDGALRPVVGRLSPDGLAHLYLHRPLLRQDIAPFWRAWMADSLLVPRRSRGFGGGYSHYRDRALSFALWCADQHDDALAMVKASWNHSKARENILFDHGEGAGWALLVGLAPTDPDLVKSIWRGAIDDTGTMWVSTTEHFPARLPSGTVFDDLRTSMLLRARTDERLFAAVRELEANGHQTFLIRWIREHLECDLPADRAIALSVAGFLDAGEEALELWSGVLAVSPGPGWLEKVYDHSRVAFERGQRSRHWYQELWEARDEESAMRAWWLLGLVADDRVRLFFRQTGVKVRSDSWRAQWLDFLRPEVAPQRERFGKSMSKSWMHGAVPSDLLKTY